MHYSVLFLNVNGLILDNYFRWVGKPLRKLTRFRICLRFHHQGWTLLYEVYSIVYALSMKGLNSFSLIKPKFKNKNRTIRIRQRSKACKFVFYLNFDQVYRILRSLSHLYYVQSILSVLLNQTVRMFVYMLIYMSDLWGGISNDCKLIISGTMWFRRFKAEY